MKSGQCPVVNYQVLLHLPKVHPLDLGCSNPVVGGVQNLHLFPNSKLGWEFQVTLTFNDTKWHILLRGAWHHQQSRRDFVPFFAAIGRLISWISPTWFLTMHPNWRCIKAIVDVGNTYYSYDQQIWRWLATPCVSCVKLTGRTNMDQRVSPWNQASRFLEFPLPSGKPT